ncbi:MAG: hypothetical protein KKC29_14445 [Alphaproteobacteria bacterium]|jgi:hypothetical protein|nr:hypothetical protein [Alphaproteobacteria bacterium]MBU2041084.1 hypothetical protein [Alphaproteobacteria bacterium]MBU2125706.1 hypothetical protein [Alphaproteobacteria bacterium]MBU2209198.1 hypothetical protein [Alphaproteobacteria bacterium]MBU2292286.1 hypothetical protein [Alphaproteobacteria bacterium]
MFALLLAFALVAIPGQDAPPAPAQDTSERYGQAMRCAGVMAAVSSLHAFNGNAEAKSRTDRNGRGFITAATGYAQPLGLTEAQLAEAFAASTGQAIGSITQTRDQAATDAAIDQLNADHDACLRLAQGWVAEANGTS